MDERVERRKRRRPGEAEQGIPTDVWRSLLPIMIEMRGPLLGKLWRSLIEANWVDFDLYRNRVQGLLDEYDRIRFDEPKISDDDPGWSGSIETERDLNDD